jgi:hypothetical protein
MAGSDPGEEAKISMTLTERDYGEFFIIWVIS